MKTKLLILMSVCLVACGCPKDISPEVAKYIDKCEMEAIAHGWPTDGYDIARRNVNPCDNPAVQMADAAEWCYKAMPE